LAEIIEIGDGDSRCLLAPGLGGSIVSWTIAGQSMLRSASKEAIAAANRLGFSSFPLVPYSNRIGHGRFDWRGRQIRLSPNFAPEPHAIHGTGWEDNWHLEHHSRCETILKLDHEGDARWPWSFTARQHLTVGADWLTLSMTAENEASEPAPLAFGHHPYFDRTGASLAFKADRVWLNGDDMLPTKAVAPSGAFDFSAGRRFEGLAVDHCYAGWNGRARIAWEGRPFSLDIVSDMRVAIVYVPRDGDYFCFEPVPHITNALNLPGSELAMPMIGAGESFGSMIRLSAVKS
jgi:aldose 1-epimerase